MDTVLRNSANRRRSTHHCCRWSPGTLLYQYHSLGIQPCDSIRKCSGSRYIGRLVALFCQADVIYAPQPYAFLPQSKQSLPKEALFVWEYWDFSTYVWKKCADLNTDTQRRKLLWSSIFVTLVAKSFRDCYPNITGATWLYQECVASFLASTFLT